MTEEPRCSFCHAPRSQRRKVIEGNPGTGRVVFICDLCVKLAQTPFATIAFCSNCKPVNGKHAPDCDESA